MEKGEEDGWMTSRTAGLTKTRGTTQEAERSGGKSSVALPGVGDDAT